MDPLMSRKVKRKQPFDSDYESASQQSTLEGLQSFHARQEARRRRVQADANEVAAKVRVIKGSKP